MGTHCNRISFARCLVLANSALDAPAKAMADRIGKNREFLGVHFPSDTEASERLAEKVVELLRNVPRFKEIVVRASIELRRYGESPERRR